LPTPALYEYNSTFV